MRVISIINLKGGVGKTHTAANMAYGLAQQGNDVLLIDNDPQGNLSKLFDRYDPNKESGTARLLRGAYAHLGNIIDYINLNHGNLNIITGNMFIETAVNELKYCDNGTQLQRFNPLITHTILDNWESMEEKPYDYIIIDNPPALGLNVLNALAITDDVIVPVKVDNWALEGLDIILNTIKEMQPFNNKLRFAGVLLTMWKNTETNIAGYEWLKDHGYKMFDTKIWYSDKATESTFFTKTIAEYAPRSWPAQRYKRLVNEYLEKTRGL